MSSVPVHPAPGPDRAILVVDAWGSDEGSSALRTLLDAMAAPALEAALARAGIRGREPGRPGDGGVVVLPAETLPRLLHPFLGELEAELRERDRHRLVWEPRLRLRASIDLGRRPVPGPPRQAHRLLDSEPVRRALDGVRGSAAFLSAIVSRRVYEEVVEPGLTALRPAQFRQVAGRAYLLVAAPSAPGGDTGRDGGS